MSAIQYKLKTGTELNLVRFDGVSISVADLKKLILHQEKIRQCSGFEPKIMNAQTEEVYNNDETLIPRNTTVIVSGLPVQYGTKNNRSFKPDLLVPTYDVSFRLIGYDIKEASQEYNPSDIFVINIGGPLQKKNLITSTGSYGVPLIPLQAYMEEKKKTPPFVPHDVPKYLLCKLCNELIQDAVIIPCCANCFCDECVRQILLESENHECPVCHQTEVSPDSLIPDRYLRTDVTEYCNGKEFVFLKEAASVPQPQCQRGETFPKYLQTPESSVSPTQVRKGLN